jgi:hypothetical protein
LVERQQWADFLFWAEVLRHLDENIRLNRWRNADRKIDDIQDRL